MSASEKYWRSHAARVSRRVNSGWFFHKAAPILIIGGLLFAIAVVFLRSARPDFVSPLWLGLSGGVLLLIACGLAFGLAKKHFIDQHEGLVRLDDHFSLNNSLTAASQGASEWPQARPMQHSHGGLSWKTSSVLLPMLATALIILTALFVPIPDLNAKTDQFSTNEPGAWKQMEEWLDELKEEDLIDEDTLEEAREKIEELRDQPEEEWYSHSSMEATDSLRNSMGRDLVEAARDLAILERDIAALENFSGQMSEAARDMLMKEYDEALKNLGLNNMQLNEDLMKQLQNMDLGQLAQGNLNQLTKEQIEQLRKQLQEGCQ